MVEVGEGEGVGEEEEEEGGHRGGWGDSGEEVVSLQLLTIIYPL